MIRQFMRRLSGLETAAKPARKSSWTLASLSREEAAAKLKEYREWFAEAEGAGVTIDFNNMEYINDRE
jgi:hypothetical protein